MAAAITIRPAYADDAIAIERLAALLRDHIERTPGRRQRMSALRSRRPRVA